MGLSSSRSPSPVFGGGVSGIQGSPDKVDMDLGMFLANLRAQFKITGQKEVETPGPDCGVSDRSYDPMLLYKTEYSAGSSRAEDDVASNSTWPSIESEFPTRKKTKGREPVNIEMLMDDARTLSMLYDQFYSLNPPQPAAKYGHSENMVIKGFHRGIPVLFLETPLYRELRRLQVYCGLEFGIKYTVNGVTPNDKLLKQPGGLVDVQEVLADPESKKVLYATKDFEIRKSVLGGLGAFAVRDLSYGEPILYEEPLLRLESIALGLFPAYKKLDEGRRAIFDSLHGFALRPGGHHTESIAHANAFEVRGRGYAIMAIASRFNHKCQKMRNISYAYDGNRELLVFTVRKNLVPAGTELCIDYGGIPLELYRRYGFRCNCGGCRGPAVTDDAIQKSDDVEFTGDF